jgi:hypothetical protein
VFGSIKRHEVLGGEKKSGSIIRHEVFGSIKKHEVSRGEGSIKRHEVSGGEAKMGPSKHMRFQEGKQKIKPHARVSKHCLVVGFG